MRSAARGAALIGLAIIVGIVLLEVVDKGSRPVGLRHGHPLDMSIARIIKHQHLGHDRSPFAAAARVASCASQDRRGAVLTAPHIAP